MDICLSICMEELRQCRYRRCREASQSSRIKTTKYYRNNPTENVYFCCILTLDRAINQRFLWTGRTCENNRQLSRGWSEIMGIMKWYMQMPTRGSQSVWVLSQCSISAESNRQRENCCCRGPSGPWREPFKHVLSEGKTVNTVWYVQEKK